MRRTTPRVVNVADAKARLPELIARAERAEEIILARNGTPRARLVPLAVDRTLRVPGKGKGRFRVRRGFDAPLDDEATKRFEDELRRAGAVVARPGRRLHGAGRNAVVKHPSAGGAFSIVPTSRS